MTGEVVRVVTKRVERGRAEVDVLVLTAHAPMIGEGILQAATDHPAGVRVAGITQLMESRSRRKLVELLEEVEVTDGQATSHIRHPAAEGITNARTDSEEVVGLEGGRDVVISDRSGESTRAVAVTQPQTTAGRFEA